MLFWVVFDRELQQRSTPLPKHHAEHPTVGHAIALEQPLKHPALEGARRLFLQLEIVPSR